MKIDSRSANLTPLEQIRNKKKEEASVSAASAAEVRRGDRIDIPLSSALQDAIAGIESSGISAGEMHSHLKLPQVERLLSDSPVEALRPKLPEANLLALADHIADQMRRNPQAAIRAFGDLNPVRAVELL